MKQLIGTIDAYYDGQIIGWAWNPEAPDQRVEIDVVVDGRSAKRLVAQAFRKDLASAGIGDGRYAFFIMIDEVASEGARLVDLRFASTGEPLSRSPIDLTQTLTPHKTRLLELLQGSPFWVSDFRFDGRECAVSGFYHPKNGRAPVATLELDGVKPIDFAWLPVDETTRRSFWFLSPKTGGFEARFAIGQMPPTSDDAFRISLRDPIEALDPLRAFSIPASIPDYRNLPSADRQRRVMGWADDLRFVFLGRTHYETNRMLMAMYGKPVARVRRLLDLGVGCGRIARHFLAREHHIEVHGIDIDADNVAWCREHLPRGRFLPGRLTPPLNFASNFFDFVHANSVFTHLTEDIQDLWLDEIARILTHDGIAVITVHSETAAAYARMPLEWLDRWVAQGIDAFGVNEDLAGFIDDPEYYRNSYHTTEYIREHWARHVSVLGFHRHLFGYQDAVVIRKKQATSQDVGNSIACAVLPIKEHPADAPMCGFDAPMTKSREFRIAYLRYVDLLIRSVNNTIYEDPPLTTWGDREFDTNKRALGRDWPSQAHTMIGTARLRNLADLVTCTLDDGIPGDFIETGVWRGGACILMRGLLAAYGDTTRRVFVADSFAGLPAPSPDRYPSDKDDTLYLYPELAISREQVRGNFERYGLLDERVVFLEGLFKDTLPSLRHERFSILRLDGDMYESTMDGLENLYDAVAVGGFIIVDDYGAIEACRRAVHDFREGRGITEPIVEIDWTGVYWRKQRA